MPYIEINGANLYYETYGTDRPGQVPIVLIHGSTGTGRSNWSHVAPLLARDYHVIVPDCRGHGRSSNPNNSYSFKEMAADTAGLVRALGYARAHIIGHSNGGNVATVILLEHPEVVQTAIPQAANAWVSPDLIEKEPPIFDPDRVQRESPDWMNEMIELHAQAHGPDYWRDLLQMTVKEIISEPNYTPEDLQTVQRPTLVIQGEKDRVNAPYKHAQFIARHIPDAELWIPANIGHSVHDEILFQWIEKVLDFLKRRGDDDNDALYRLGRRRFQDKREWIFDVHADPVQQDGRGNLKLRGQVLTGEQHQAVLDLFRDHLVEDGIQILLAEDTPWAFINHAVTDLRREPRRLSERVSQALLGEAVRLIEEGDEWVHVRLETDGYLGWVRANALHRCEKAEVENYQKSRNYVVIVEAASATSTSVGGQERVEAGKLPFGTLVPVIDRRKGMAAALLPDGTFWWVAETNLLPISSRPKPDPEGITHTLDAIRTFIGAPYLWGGRTPYGFDCSGLAQTFWRFMGIPMPRDADQQFRTGTPVEDTFQAGDLLFFGESNEDSLPGEPGTPERRISHVAISLGDLDLIHASGGPDRVTINSLDPASPVYSAWLRDHLAGVRRYR